jgi:hypothetical protein
MRYIVAETSPMLNTTLSAGDETIGRRPANRRSCSAGNEANNEKCRRTSPSVTPA